MNTQSSDAQAPFIQASMNFVVPGDRPNRRYVAGGAELSIGRFEARSVPVRNARPFADALTLDSAGFTLLRCPTAVGDFFDTGEVNRLYPGEVINAVQQATRADHVLSMGWMIRTSGDAEKLRQSPAYQTLGGGIQPPGADVHVDVHFSKAARRAEAFYRKHYPKGPGYSRFIFTSFWRAFSEPPQDWPLALCDGSSVPPTAGVPNTMVIVDRIPEEAQLYAPIPDEDALPAASIFHYDPALRWWYYPDMKRDEALLFKFFDSDHSRAWRVPHTAFHDTSRADTHIRRSIEYRTIAYFD